MRFETPNGGHKAVQISNNLIFHDYHSSIYRLVLAEIAKTSRTTRSVEKLREILCEARSL